ncbi:hypothetical protein PR202_gb01912 [Eleusine coracana subsp. coracana]|uniref:Uncharacterized protein n=1 Tax=Eleusine coracana subsp. coracana TaxID=191504 RepID=A0AAV5DXX8_ELECO|nr:hypothetical protein PR202_gb01912 [Eleusine coracana subsp. coracana]
MESQGGNSHRRRRRHMRLVVKLFFPNDLIAEILSQGSGATGRASGGVNTVVRDDSTSAFFNGALHLTTLDSSSSVVMVDTGGKTWGRIPTPRHFDFIGMSQAVRTGGL